MTAQLVKQIYGKKIIMPYKDKKKQKACQRKSALKHYRKNRVAKMKANKVYEIRMKDQVFENYGGYICKCCGETKKLFLTLDHINGGGRQHRKEAGGGGKFTYRWVKRNKYPEGFQVLCYNCNCGRQRNGGICPHKQ